MKRPLGIALLGCGTVGGGVLRLLEQNADRLAARIGAPVAVHRVLVRDRAKPRVEACDRAWITTNPNDVFDDDRVDVVLEVIGGVEPAGTYLARAIERGFGVVTANKTLVASRGAELCTAAAARGVDLAFEASVGGGIPIVRTLREAMTSDRVDRVVGIVNGTCNYILSKMREEGLDFAVALAEAQQKGFAEADPTLDVDGHDAAQKLAVLAMLAFGAEVNVAKIPTEGIRQLDGVDLRFADRFGFVPKHLAVGLDHGDRVELRVHPALVPQGSVLANVSGVMNAIALDAKALGPCVLTGRGAGDLPTAVSVVADLVDVARARIEGAGGLSTKGIRLAPRPIVPRGEGTSRAYLRFTVVDRPLVMATIAGALGAEGVSIEQMVQEGRGDAVEVVMLTHTCRMDALERALRAIDASDVVTRPAKAIRIEEP